MEEAIELCERAIRELPAAAACQGYFIRGCYRLHSYEDAGIGDIYFAIETNKNYLDEGMPMIGNYCCLTGNQQELERYRERAVELSQEDKDMYSQILELKKNDHLSSETLPEGILEGILAYIRSVEDGQIETCCQFCKRKYVFTGSDIEKLREKFKKEKAQTPKDGE